MKNAMQLPPRCSGKTIVLRDEYIELFGRDDLRGVLCEVVDARLGNGMYVYTVAPVSPTGVDLTRSVSGVFADDFTYHQDQ